MTLLRRLVAYSRVMGRGQRNRTDLVRYLARRPALLAAVSGYEMAVLVSNRVDSRLKALATLRVSSLVGCPF